MRTTTAWVAGQESRRLAHADPGGSLRRGELAAGLASAALLSELVFAPVTLLIAATLVAVGRVSRWRPAWLLAPAVAGLVWLLQAGAAQGVASFVLSARQLPSYLLAATVHPARLAQPGAAFADAAARLPGQLPLALLIAAGEASIVLWLVWWRAWARATAAVASGVVAATGRRFRPGLVALARCRVSAAALSGGRTVTADGCALGLQISTGELAGFSWAAAENGVLLTGAHRPDLDQLGLAAVCAALRIRKTVLLADLTNAGLAWQVTAMARRLGVAASETSGEGVASLAGRAIRRRGVVAIWAGTGDDPGQVIDDLTGVLAGLRDLGLQADCLIWVSGCEAGDHDCLAGLLRLGGDTGTAMLLSTTSATYAAGLAASAGTIVAAGPVSGKLLMELTSIGSPIGRQVASAAPLRAALALSRPTLGVVSAEDETGDSAIHDILRGQLPAAFTILAESEPGAGQSRVTPHCRVVPLALGDVQ